MIYRLRQHYLIVIILVLAFVLRVWGLWFGLPQLHVIDEGEVVYSAFYMAGNRLKPFWYLHAPLVPMLVLAEYGIWFLVGKLLGVFSAPQDLAIIYLQDPTIFVLLGRITTVVASLVSVYLVWLIGKRFFKPSIGIIASFFLAVSFLHVQNSHYMKGNVLAGMLVLASAYYAYELLAKGKSRSSFLSGLFVGLASGARYPAGIALAIGLLAHVLKRKVGWRRRVLVFGGGAVAGFSLAVPYFILDLKGTVSGIVGDFLAHPAVVYAAQLEGGPVWWHFVSEHIPEGIGWLMMFSAVAGFGVSLLRGKKKSQYYLLAVYPVAFILTVGLWTKSHFARYAVTVVPFLALGAAVFVDFASQFVSKGEKRRVFLISACMIIGFTSLIRSMKFNFLLTISDTRRVATEWVMQNIPFGSKVLVESTLRPEYRSNYNVSLALSEEQIADRLKEAEKLGLAATYLNTLLQASRGQDGYEIVASPRADALFDSVTSELSYVNSVSKYQEQGVEYIILSSWARKGELDGEFVSSLEDDYKQVAVFEPKPTFFVDPHFVRMDYDVLDAVAFDDKDLVFGPRIKVYKARNDGK